MTNEFKSPNFSANEMSNENIEFLKYYKIINYLLQSKYLQPLIESLMEQLQLLFVLEERQEAINVETISRKIQNPPIIASEKTKLNDYLTNVSKQQSLMWLEYFELKPKLSLMHTYQEQLPLEFQEDHVSPPGRESSLMNDTLVHLCRMVALGFLKVEQHTKAKIEISRLFSSNSFNTEERNAMHNHVITKYPQINDKQKGRNASECIDFQSQLRKIPKESEYNKTMYKNENKQICAVRPGFERVCSSHAMRSRSTVLTASLPSHDTLKAKVHQEEENIMRASSSFGLQLMDSAVKDVKKYQPDFDKTADSNLWAFHTRTLNKERMKREAINKSMFAKITNKLNSAKSNVQVNSKVSKQLHRQSTINRIQQEAQTQATAEFKVNYAFASKVKKVQKDVKYQKEIQRIDNRMRFADEEGHMLLKGMQRNKSMLNQAELKQALLKSVVPNYCRGATDLKKYAKPAVAIFSNDYSMSQLGKTMQEKFKK